MALEESTLMKRDMPGMRCRARAKFCTSGKEDLDSTRPVAMRKMTPSTATLISETMDGRFSGRRKFTPQYSTQETTKPTRPEPEAHSTVCVTALPPRLPSLRLSRKPPMTAPETKPKPLAVPSRITTRSGLDVINGAKSVRTILVSVMPAMMKVGVQASSRA